MNSTPSCIVAFKNSRFWRWEVAADFMPLRLKHHFKTLTGRRVRLLGIFKMKVRTGELIWDFFRLDKLKLSHANQL
jgi:hypothetical protein